MAKELNRNRLKTHFKAGAIPREEHFAELFDNSLNQLDDGIRKSDHTGLEIEAAPGSGEAILFFRDFEFQGGPAEPDWKMIVQQNDEATGLNVTNTDDESRLFIDLATGNVAIGTVKTPENDKLHVAGNLSIQRDQHLLFRGDGQLRSGVWNETGQAYQDMEKHQILFRSSEKILELREEGRIVFSPGSTDGLPTAKLTIDAAGNLFIGSVPTGSPNPDLKLYVGGNTKVAGGLETTGAVTVGTDLTVRGTTTNEIIKVHQVIGKVAQQDAVGPLYLNPASEQNVEIASAAKSANLLVHGKIGIGTAADPTYALQIGEAATTAGDRFLSIQAKESSDPNNKYSTGVKLAIGNDEWTIRHDDHADRRGFNVGYKTPDQAEELTRLRIDEQGKVLIGATGTATAASVKLEVIGDVKANTVQATTFSGTNASLTEKLTTKQIDGVDNGKVSIGPTGASAGLKLEVNGDAKATQLIADKVLINRTSAEKAANVKLEVNGDIDAANITAATFSGNGAALTSLNASNISSGTLAKARLPKLVFSDVSEGFTVPPHDASTITSGTINTARIPDLNANKINAGTLSDSRIPSLSASKINSGEFHVDRIPSLSIDKLSVVHLTTEYNSRGSSRYTWWQLKKVPKMISVIARVFHKEKQSYAYTYISPAWFSGDGIASKGRSVYYLRYGTPDTSNHDEFENISTLYLVLYCEDDTDDNNLFDGEFDVHFDIYVWY